MKMLKKLALVSAISMISAGSFAMEAMDEDTMSATTGQDGITINIVPDAISRGQAAAMGVTAATMDMVNQNSLGFKGLSIGEIRVHDDDGLGILGTSATANSGALVVGGGYDKNGNGNFTDLGDTTVEGDRTVILAKGDKPIQINIDMVGDSNGALAGGGAMLNVEIKQPKIALKLGNIYVANSNAAEAGFDADGNTNPGGVEVDGSTVSGKVKILDGFSIVMNESTMNIQLGNEAQGGMIKADATLAGGLTINDFALYDQAGAAALTADNLLTNTTGSGGSFRAKSIKITDNAGMDLTTKTTIDFGSRTVAGAVSNGLQTATIAGTYTAFTTATPAAIPVLTGFGLTGASTRADIVAANTTATTNLTNANTAVSTNLTALNTERNTQANILVAGSTYAQLTAAQKATVDAIGSVATAQTNLTTATTAQAGAQGQFTVVNTFAVSTDGRFSIAENAAGGTAGGTSTATWGGADTYNGLVITSQLGADLAAGADITIANAVVGDLNAQVIGDVQIIGLRLGTSRIVIMGH